MKTLSLRFITIVLLFALAAMGPAPALAAAFVVSYDASAQSGSTVKLIRNGYVFTDVSPNVYTMTWNSTRGLYETTTISDATFVNDYYRIEDGSGNVVVDTFTVSSKIIDADQIEDKFLRNDGDDLTRGAITIMPAAGAFSTQVRFDNTSTDIEMFVEDTTGAGGRVLRVRAGSLDLQAVNGSTDIPITGIGQSSTANSAATRSNIDSLKGTSWSSSMTLSGHETRLDALEGTGTFTANDTLFLTGGGGRGVLSVQWSFDPTGVNDSIDHVEIYYGSTAIPGYSQSGAAALSSATLTQIRSNMPGVIYPPRGTFTANISALENYYVIVVAFDHTSPTKKAWGSNQVLVTGNDDPLDSTTPLIGTANSLVDGIEQLANEVNDIKVNLGGGSMIKVLWTNSTGAAAANSTLTRFYNTSTTATNNIVTAWHKTSQFDAIRISGQARHSDVSQVAKINCAVYTWTGVAAAMSGTTSVTSTTLTDFSLDVDCSTLTDGWYIVYMQIQDDDNSTSDTACVHFPTIETFNN